MRKLVILVMVLFAVPAFAQQAFELKNASKFFDIKINVEKCDDGYCSGKATFSFFKKGGAKRYQVIELADTQIQLSKTGQPLTNISLLYDDHSVVNVGDFNFDGMEDVAICNGANGSYGGPSYNVYLSSRAVGKFVYDKAFSELGGHLGMFEVDKKRRRLSTLDKSGCCFHIAHEFSVVGNRPVKVRTVEEDATIADDRKIKITTKTRVGGKWKTSVEYHLREE